MRGLDEENRSAHQQRSVDVAKNENSISQSADSLQRRVKLESGQDESFEDFIKRRTFANSDRYINQDNVQRFRHEGNRYKRLCNVKLLPQD